MKEKFIKSTIILVIGGFITKILGMFIRIVITRIIGVNGIGLYMLIMPTFNLFITIATMSLPITISKLVAEETRNNKNIVFGIIPIALIFNIIIIILLVILTPFISNTLLQNNLLYYPTLAIGLTLPFITLSSIIRGYFFGKEKMTPHIISHIFEQIVRIICIFIITPYLLPLGIEFAITGLILFNVVSEISSVIILLLFLPKKIKITKSDFKLTDIDKRDIFAISIPNTIGRLISSIGMFLEPIIITYVFIKLGFNNNYITEEYGIISGYVLPMLMMPSFLTSAISNALLPVITKYFQIKKINLVKKKIYQGILFSLMVGIPATTIMVLFPERCLNLIFNTNVGIDYLKLAAPIFLISYIMGPLASTLQAINKSKIVMKSTLIGMIIKIISLFGLLFLNIKMWPIIISSGISYLIIVIYQIIAINKTLKTYNL